MTWLQVVVLAIVQGITEFLPISSSGHLVLVPTAAGWADQGLAFDVAVHFGSLLTVCCFSAAFSAITTPRKPSVTSVL